MPTDLLLVRMHVDAAAIVASTFILKLREKSWTVSNRERAFCVLVFCPHNNCEDVYLFVCFKLVYLTDLTMLEDLHR